MSRPAQVPFVQQIATLRATVADLRAENAKLRAALEETVEALEVMVGVVETECDWETNARSDIRQAVKTLAAHGMVPVTAEETPPPPRPR